MDSHDEESCASSPRDRTRRMRELNDRFRTDKKGGCLCISRGIVALGAEAFREIEQAVASFSDFDGDNDPHHEHDFGELSFAGHRISWKIDCYDRAEEYVSPDPTDPSVTTRILAIMLASEY